MSNNKMNILWTNADPITSELMVLMYAKASMHYGFWEEVQVIIWGATAKLVSENTKIQKLIADAQEAGVTFTACQACVESLGVQDNLRALDIEIKYWGEPLTEILKSNEKFISI